MSAKKKSRAKTTSKKSPKREDAILNVEILQFGFPQSVGNWSSQRWFSKEISFGVGRGADLHLPYTKLPSKIRIFEIKNGKVFVVLDPRVEGFVNRGHEFGDVKEFLSPRGALAEVATIDDPLRLELKPGSRGSIRIYGFEVIFKYDFPSAAPKKAHVEGAGLGLFTQNDVDSPLESRAIWIAMGAVLCALVPFVVWLAYAKSHEYRTFASLPQEFLLRIISPEHYPSLPRILDGDGGLQAGSEGASFAVRAEDDSEKNPRLYFRKDVMVSQAAYVVGELQKRWRLAEDGVAAKSDIEFIRFPSPVALPADVGAKWKRAADEWYGKVKAVRTDPASERYYLYQAETPRLAVATTGERRGSIRLRVQKRISQLRQMHKSIASLVRTEQDFLRRYYGGGLIYLPRNNVERKTAQGTEIDKGVDLGPLFLMPAEAIFSAKPEQRFLWEIEHYQAAQALADYAAKLGDRWRRPVGDDAQGLWPSSEIVWLERDGSLEPTFTGVRIDALSGAEGSIVQNAKYSIAEKVVPPPPAPPPRVDEQAVKLAIVGKKEQIKACYESLLRRNPRAVGTVRMKWTIDANGRAKNPGIVSSTIADKELHACLTARLVQWQFPKPQNGVVGFEYPFQFTTKPR